MTRIDLVIAHEDGAARATRDALRDALHMLGLPPRWEEIEVGDDTPEELVGHPIPNVLFDGRPLAGRGANVPSRAQMIVALQEIIARR